MHSGAYSYNGNRLHFTQKSPSDKEKSLTIYKTNSAVYQTAEVVDMFCSGLILFSGYKVLRNGFVMATQAGVLASYGPFTALWALMGYV